MTDSPDLLDIAEVARRTGLSARALRFYEARGLLSPLRTGSGRRVYGRGELERLHQVILLKSAGFSLSRIKAMLGGKPVALERMVRAQIDLLDAEAKRIDESRTVLAMVLSRLDRREPIDAATLCSLIEMGERTMQHEPEEWKAVTDRYFTPAEKAEWAEKWDQLPGDFDPDAYAAQWKSLGHRIKAALPLDPAGETAQGFVDQWYALLKPFSAAASPEMWNGAARMYEDMDNWPQAEGQPQADPGFDKAVWDFMKQATAARLAAGGTIEPLAPDYWGGADKNTG